MQALSDDQQIDRLEGRMDRFEGRMDRFEKKMDDGSPPYRTFIEEHRPQLRFHYRAIDHLLQQLIVEEASWDAFFEHAGIKPVLVLYENFAGDYEASTQNLLDRLDLTAPDGYKLEPRMKKQSDSVNDDWTKRYSELRLGTEFDLVPVPSGR